MRLIRTAFLVGLLSATLVSANALVIIGFSTEKHSRFQSEWPNSPVLNSNPSFLGSDFNWSGVGRNADETYTSVAMIT